MTRFHFDKNVWIIRLSIALYIFLFFYLFYTDRVRGDEFFSIKNILIILPFTCIIIWLSYISFILQYYFYTDKIVVKRLFSKKTYLINELSNIQIIKVDSFIYYQPLSDLFSNITECYLVNLVCPRSPVL